MPVFCFQGPINYITVLTASRQPSGRAGKVNLKFQGQKASDHVTSQIFTGFSSLRPPMTPIAGCFHPLSAPSAALSIRLFLCWLRSVSDSGFSAIRFTAAVIRIHLNSSSFPEIRRQQHYTEGGKPVHGFPPWKTSVIWLLPSPSRPY